MIKIIIAASIFYVFIMLIEFDNVLSAGVLTLDFSNFN